MHDAASAEAVSRLEVRIDAIAAEVAELRRILVGRMGRVLVAVVVVSELAIKLALELLRW